MNKIIISSIIFVAINFSFSQWIQTNGPNGSYMQYSAVTGTNIYVTTVNDGIFLSTNSGSSWRNINSNIPDTLKEYSVAANGNDVFVYATTGYSQFPNGIYYSANKGQNWNLVFPIDASVSMSIGPLFFNNGRLLCGGNDGNQGNGFIMYSSNNGINWVRTDIPNSTIYGFTASGNTVYACGDKIYKSLDNGSNWSILSATINDVHQLAIKGNTFFAGTWHDFESVYRSTDNGVTWSRSFFGIPENRRTTGLVVLGNDVYVSTYVNNDGFGGVYRSTDNGSTWFPDGLTNQRVFTMGTIGNNLFGGSLFGFSVSTDFGSSWQGSNSGLPYLTVANLCSNGNETFAGTSMAAYYTTNSGNTWNISNYPYWGILATSALNSKVVMTNYKSASYSLDNGQTWIPLFSVPAGVPRLSTVAVTNSTFLVSQYTTNDPIIGSVWVTSNNGANWSSTPQATARMFVRGNSYVFSATHSGVYRSSDDGFTWTQTNNGLNNTDILSITAEGNNVVAGTNGSGPFLSTNNGTNWVPINTGLAAAVVNSLAIKGNKIFAGTNVQSNKIFMSANLGTNWIQIDGNMTNFTVNALSVDSNYLYAATSITSRVWRRPLDELTGIAYTQNNIPDKFSLTQNYPNPFNPSTKISYDLPVNGYVRLVIYDVLGRELMTLVNEKQNAGTYAVDWDASNNPSAVYFYKLTSGDFTQTRKMTLIK